MSNRVLRGGAFNNNRRNVRCAYRNNNNPDNRNNNIGFRVVVSTLFNTCRKWDAAGIPCCFPEAKEEWQSLLLSALFGNQTAGQITTALRPGALLLAQGKLL